MKQEYKQKWSGLQQSDTKAYLKLFLNFNSRLFRKSFIVYCWLLIANTLISVKLSTISV